MWSKFNIHLSAVCGTRQFETTGCWRAVDADCIGVIIIRLHTHEFSTARETLKELLLVWLLELQSPFASMVRRMPIPNYIFLELCKQVEVFLVRLGARISKSICLQSAALANRTIVCCRSWLSSISSSICFTGGMFAPFQIHVFISVKTCWTLSCSFGRSKL